MWGIANQKPRNNLLEAAYIVSPPHLGKLRGASPACPTLVHNVPTALAAQGPSLCRCSSQGQGPTRRSTLPVAGLPMPADLLLPLNEPLHDLLVPLCVLRGTWHLSTGTLVGLCLLSTSS